MTGALGAITIDLDPVLAHLGPFALRWYSLFFAAGILAGAWLALREARRRGLDPDRLEPLAIAVVAGGLVGARLFHVIDRWELYSDDPLRVFNVASGGLAVYGGIIGGVATGLVYGLRAGFPVWRLGDAGAPGILLGQAIGRIGCIPNGDVLGERSDLPWAFVYENPNSMVSADLLGVPTQPYAVYDALFNLALLAVVWRLRSVFRRDGLLFLTYAGLYATGRFLLTFLRTEKVWVWGLQEAQVLSLVVIVAAAGLLAWRTTVASLPARASGAA